MAHFKQACVFLCAFCCSLFTSCGAAAPGSFSQNPEAPASSGPAAAGSATSQMEIAQQTKQLSETLEALVALRDETYGGTFSYNMHVGLEYERAYYEVSGADIPFQSLAEVQAIYPTMRLPETVSGQALAQVEISASDNALARECQKGSIPQQPFAAEVLPEHIESLAAVYGKGEQALTLSFWSRAALQPDGWEQPEALQNGYALVRYGSPDAIALQWEGMDGTFHLSGEESALREAAQENIHTIIEW